MDKNAIHIHLWLCHFQGYLLLLVLDSLVCPGLHQQLGHLQKGEEKQISSKLELESYLHVRVILASKMQRGVLPLVLGIQVKLVGVFQQKLDDPEKSMDGNFRAARVTL